MRNNRGVLYPCGGRNDTWVAPCDPGLGHRGAYLATGGGRGYGPQVWLLWRVIRPLPSNWRKSMASVVFDHVVKRYAGDVLAVKDLNMEIKDKEFLVLVGPSGCG